MSTKNKYISWFNAIEKDDVGIVGGKGTNLGIMSRAGFPVPFGFVVTAQSYFEIIKENDLEKEIRNFCELIDFENPHELHDASVAIRNIIRNAHVPKHIISEIHTHYNQIVAKEHEVFKKSVFSSMISHVAHSLRAPLVAVRSSATAEDLPDASFAGQQETFLNVQGENQLLEKIKECWSSLFTERAMYYRHHQKYDHLKVGLAAVVQRMVQSDQSGISFSIDPITNDRNVVTVEAIHGLGEYIVGGVVTPDHYEVQKETYNILKKEIKHQNVALVRKGSNNVEVKLSKDKASGQKISDSLVKQVAKVVCEVEKHYGFPQDIEWAIEDDVVFVVQSRPITTIDEVTDTTKQFKSESDATAHMKVLVTGSPASPGIGIGKPVIIMTPADIDKIHEGDVLVAPMTDPDYVPAMKRASAIITELGGRTSHAAIVSRELGIPAVVGAEGAVKILKNIPMISVDGVLGKVYEGELAHSTKAEEKKHKKVHTHTKIYVNLAQIDQSEKVAAMDVDGIGLLRAEFMMANIGIHPKKALEDGKRKEFVKEIEKNLLKVTSAFSPRPVIYRATDFKSNEYRNLKGGVKFEFEEENPMLGFRGASRYIVWKDVFDMELEAIKKVRDAGYKNLHIMIPFIRTPLELLEIKSILKEHGLEQSPTFKLWIMVEVPSTVIMLEEFIKIGIDGVSIGTNDLTMLIMGVDRDNAKVAHLYSEMNPAVQWALKKIVTTARKHDITVSVCGQAPSDYPQLAQSLVEWGATSLSLNPDAVDRTRLLIHELEKTLWEKSRRSVPVKS